MDLTQWAKVLEDPLLFQRACWPDITLYDKQAEILYSVRDNEETYVPAGNQLGKDFVTALAVLWFFCSRSPCRVVTSSVDQPQLRGVLWGEIRRFVQSSRLPLPIELHDMIIRQLKCGVYEPRSYLIGRVTAKGEGLLGHHLERGPDFMPRTLMVFDEASGVDTTAYEACDTWAHRKLVIGNPYPTTNFFFQKVKAGDKRSEHNYHRKIIRIKATDSPNVRLALEEKKRGNEPSHKVLIPGVLDYRTYLNRRENWDEIRQMIGLDAVFPQTADVMLYPLDWLLRANDIADQLDSNRSSDRRTMGIDPAEGGDSTVWTVVDVYGILEQISIKTKDTSTIADRTIGLIKQWDIEPQDVAFDRGGGGKQIADFLRRKKYNVQTIGFGEKITPPATQRRNRSKHEIIEQIEQRYVYMNRRAEMYGILRNLLDPGINPDGFGIPRSLKELIRQLEPLPLLYDQEGRIYLPPKDKKPNSKETSIKEMLGCSPDESDSLVLATYVLTQTKKRKRIGGLF